MKIILAGHNIDQEIIREFREEHPERQDLTPETVAAAYARISRYPKPVNELRAIARGEVEKARASNRNIVFEMGHSSIAEHAVFNLTFWPFPAFWSRRSRGPALRPTPKSRSATFFFRTTFSFRRRSARRTWKRLLSPPFGIRTISTTDFTRSSAPGSSTGTRNWPPIRRTAGCWKDGPRRMPGTVFRSPPKRSSA